MDCTKKGSLSLRPLMMCKEAGFVTPPCVWLHNVEKPFTLPCANVHRGEKCFPVLYAREHKGRKWSLRLVMSHVAAVTFLSTFS